MPRRKKERGRPVERGYPPRIDATPEEIAQKFFRTPTKKISEDAPTYRCAECQREVSYPETLYRDGRCEACTKALDR